MEYRYKGSLAALENADPVGDGGSVALVCHYAGAPATAVWRPGPRVLDALRVWPGTAIATFAAPSAGYTSMQGQCAALFLAAGPPDAEGRPSYIVILEQAPQQRILPRIVRRYTPQQAKGLRLADCDNAEAYYLIR
ncbi:BPSL0067 family protein [Pseudoduganella sp. FT25W]|uniref:BPSL0067 family protein n=1 Tax=Duganella alba TaxID=2666081 RepID=A0A6L5QDM6_9BURK|nr:BPSL0067 family protein [Duganella alba]MRX07769.1 BPSL0067 family protein [Duganella alba]MRX15372.1 BPSL0067 family protein [Duganella alba]